MRLLRNEEYLKLLFQIAGRRTAVNSHLYRKKTLGINIALVVREHLELMVCVNLWSNGHRTC